MPRQDRNAANIHVANIEATAPPPEDDYASPYADYIPQYVDYDNPDQHEDPELELYTNFYAAAVRLVDDTEWRDNRCFNCKETGHFWRNCPKPLKEEFQKMKDRLE